jgi:hypothetical protein
MAKVLDISKLETSDILSVYSGRAGKCCCGCSGNHRYNSAYIAEGSKKRGYAVDAEDVNDKQVRRVLRILQANSAKAEQYDRHISVTLGDRLYIAYLTD